MSDFEPLSATNLMVPLPLTVVSLVVHTMHLSLYSLEDFSDLGVRDSSTVLEKPQAEVSLLLNASFYFR
jgi:hypothetical protein